MKIKRKILLPLILQQLMQVSIGNRKNVIRIFEQKSIV